MFTPADSMGKAVGLFFASVFSGLFLAIVGGLVIDVTYSALLNAGFFNLPPEYETNLLSFLINMFYVCCVCIPLYGVYIMVITIYHQYVVQDGEDEDDSESSMYLGGNV